MITLSIDTSNNKEVTVALNINNKNHTLSREVGRERSQVVLPLIKELLEINSLKLENIEEIQVVVGPGSFTGLRVGVAVANTLGLILQIPINANRIGELVEPVYS